MLRKTKTAVGAAVFQDDRDGGQPQCHSQYTHSSAPRQAVFDAVGRKCGDVDDNELHVSADAWLSPRGWPVDAAAFGQALLRGCRWCVLRDRATNDRWRTSIEVLRIYGKRITTKRGDLIVLSLGWWNRVSPVVRWK